MKQILLTSSFGDEVICDNRTNTIHIDFTKPRHVLSTSVRNGGYREDLDGIYNHTSSGEECYMLAPTLHGHMRKIDEILGFDQKCYSGMVTAADVANVAIRTKTYEALTVTAIVTAGIENNAARPGDPTPHYFPVDKTQHHCGTINIILLIDADMPPGIMARALVTCSEAKAAALQELLYDSLFSSGLATGSGTDQTIIVANPDSDLLFENAGKHDKLGELIGLAVIPAVKEALFLETGIDGEAQHDILRRLRRFGITEETLWERYTKMNSEVIQKEHFLISLQQIRRRPDLLVTISLFAHLMDQHTWRLITDDAVIEGLSMIFETKESMKDNDTICAKEICSDYVIQHIIH